MATTTKKKDTDPSISALIAEAQKLLDDGVDNIDSKALDNLLDSYREHADTGNFLTVSGE